MNFSRQESRFNPAQFALKVAVIGLGGVGGDVVYELVKHGVSGVVGFDHDTVAPENPPGQLYRVRDAGQQKATVLRDIVVEFADGEFTGFAHKVIEELPEADVLFLCVDDMGARKSIMHAAFRSTGVRLVIETRVDADSVVVFTVIPQNVEHQELWDHYWFPNEEAENNGGCSVPTSLGVTSSIAAQIAVNQLFNWFGNGEKDLALVSDHHIVVTLRPQFTARAATW